GKRCRYTQQEENMLDFIGTVVTATLMVFAVNAVIIFMATSRFAKLALALAIGVWIGLSAAAGAAGMIGISKPFPVVGIFVALPLLAAAIATSSPAARRAMLSVPMPLMIGLNIGRIFAGLFFLLAGWGPPSRPLPSFPCPG